MGELDVRVAIVTGAATGLGQNATLGSSRVPVFRPITAFRADR